MAICFVRAKVVSRGGGGSAAAAAAYRSGEKIRDEATGKTHDYTKKQGVDHSEILSPVAATDRNEWLTNRSALWNRVEASEKRYDAQLAREMIIAIPRELAQPDQIELVRKYVQSTFVDRGMIADINLHHLDGTNPHAHVMLTMRELKIDEEGVVSFGNKDRSWNDKKLLETQIKEWSDFANQYLERAGVSTRIDSRSYEEQGISRIPQIHLGKNVTAMRRQGIPTERGDLYDQIDKANQDICQNLEKIYQAESAIHQLEQTRLDTERYRPTAKDFSNWYAASTGTEQEQIGTLFDYLKADYMAEDFMQGKPYPGRIPNAYQSDSLSITLRTKQMLDQMVATKIQADKVQAEGAIRDLGKDETSRPQREVNDKSKSHTQEPSPDFERTRSDLEDLARRPQRHDPIQTERRNQPGASSRPDREDRTDRNQPDRDFRTDSGDRAVGDLRPEDTQNRPNPDIEQTEPTGSASGSNPDFAAIQAGLIELSNQTRDRRTDSEHSSEGERHPGSNRPRRVDGVRYDDVDGSQHQRHPQATDSAGTQVNSAISNPTTEAEKAKPKPIKRPQLQIRPRTERDVTPTAGELRETYRQKSTFGDKIGLAEIEKVGLELNRVYQQIYPDREKAPDDFKHPDVWIDGKLLEVSIPVTINIDPESKSQKRERNQDYGMSM